jgi:hypothetical protein
VHFMLDCRVLHPVRDDFPLLFWPTCLPGPPKSKHLKYIFNHNDHVMLVRCISALKSRRDRSLELIDKCRLDEIMPEDYTPFDYNLWRILGFDMN